MCRPRGQWCAWSAPNAQRSLKACDGKPNQTFVFKGVNGAFTVEQDGLCVDQGL